MASFTLKEPTQIQAQSVQFSLLSAGPSLLPARPTLLPAEPSLLPIQAFAQPATTRQASDPKLIAWIKGLQNFLFYGILAVLFPDKTIRKQYVSANAMALWEKSFIHSSVNINNNYETLETIGDAVLSASFDTYILRLHPDKDITPSILTNYNSKFMSKENQRDLAHRYGFDNWLRIDSDMTPDTSDIEDVFESFCGALYLISEDLSLGSGQHNVYRFLEVVLHDFKDIRTIPKWGPAKTQVKEIYQGLKWTAGIERKGAKEYFIYERVPRQEITFKKLSDLGITNRSYITYVHRYRILLTEEAKRWINTYNENMKDKPGFRKNELIEKSLEGTKVTGEKILYYAEEVGLTETIAAAKAFETGLNVLRRHGISRDWVEDWARKSKMERPYFHIINADGSDINLSERASIIWSRWLSERGLVGDDVSIEEIGENKKIQGKKSSGIFHLIGRDSFGKRYLLGKATMPSGKGKEFELQLQKELLQKYVNADGADPVYS